MPVALPLPPRQQIIEFLHRELVGPDPVEPHRQSNGEEVLINDPPTLRYGAGVLFPQAAPVEVVAVENTEGLGAPESEDSDTGQITESTRGGFAGDGAGVEEADELVSLTNAFLPSAIGFSCLTEVPRQGLIAFIEAATYATESRQEVGKDGRQYKKQIYNRRPFSASVTLSPDLLLRDEVTLQTVPVTDAETGAPLNLSIRVLSRPYNQNEPQLRLLTLALVNTQSAGGRVEGAKCFFQVQMKLRAAGECRHEEAQREDTDGERTGVFLEYPDETLDPDEEEQSLALLYRHRKTYGIGHGCAAAWHEVDEATGRSDEVRTDVLPVHEIKPIVPRVFDDLPLSMLALSDRGNEAEMHTTLASLCDRYEWWINEQRALMQSADFPEEYQNAAQRHLARCIQCLKRMRGGLTLLRNDAQVRHAFRLSNRAMLQQQLHYLLGTDPEQARQWKASENGRPSISPLVWPDINNPPAKKGTWYPFQLAFVLMNLRSLAEENGNERGIVDLIWFPTGGGKTEAYLGLTAFTIILRRLRHPEDTGTSVLMRYTLRLLTAQQFQRAASLICALEKMRQDGDIASTARISIGLWAGGALTPNKREDAKKALQALEGGDSSENPFVLLNCPWCGARMGMVEVGARKRVLGYETERAPHLSGVTTVLFRCADTGCDFGGTGFLPLGVIDEDLYASPPTLLIGTVDKFAMLPWNAEARRFFGGDEQRPPDLVIQDELHLISGPLGSMVGHYETVISELCSREDEEGRRIAPKIVASTATISRADEQCHGLWNCGKENVFQFPPQCL